MKKEAILTDHAKKRIRERIGKKKDSAERAAQIALEEGIKKSETSGSLNRYLTKVQKSGKGSTVRVYGNAIYIFADYVCITVLPLPTNYQATVAKIRKRKEEKET